MPRQNSGQEVWKSLSALTAYRQVSAGGSTTAAAAITAGATAVNFTSGTSFTSGDPLIIAGSSGTELNAITNTTPTTAVPLLYPAAMANPSGAQLLEAVAVDLGHLTQEGVQFNPASPLAPFFSALGHMPIAYLRGFGEFMATFALTGFNILNLQTMLGMTESEGGAGTAADPYRGAFIPGNIGSQGIQCLRATGVLMDGRTVLVDFNNAFIEPQGAIPLSRGIPTPIPMQMRFTSVVARIYT
jgi:hypothetical protein